MDRQEDTFEKLRRISYEEMYRLWTTTIGITCGKDLNDLLNSNGWTSTEFLKEYSEPWTDKKTHLTD